jgi:predicted SnoaL-like aldol condensation-catalyzing enzyme
MSQKLENAKNLYLEGILKGHYREAVTAFTGDVYKQHSTGVRDGKEGFIEFFGPFVERNPIRDIQIIRTIEDGQYVFVTAYQSLNDGEAKWITTDFFDTDKNDKIIEHWDVIATYVEPNANGKNMINGPTEITDENKTTSNKQIVAEFLDHVLKTGDMTNIEKYISKHTFIEHNHDVDNGIDSFKHYITNKALPIRYEDTVLLVGQGNFVATLSRVYFGETEMCQADVFRLENDLIVEHWVNYEEVLSNVTDFNSGKF